MMTTKIYIGLITAAVLAIGIIGGSVWSNRKIAKLENSVEEAKRIAISIQQTAVSKEIEAAQYKEKIEYLENQLTAIQTIARKQDEELEKLNDNSVRARGDASRARSTRAVAATTAELCAKLAELGHACE